MDLIVPGDYPTIQAALDASVAGDDIVINAGTYNESGLHVDHGVTIRSSLPPNPVEIVGDDTQRILDVQLRDAPLHLSYVVIAHGAADEGGGLRIVVDPLAAPTEPSSCEFTSIRDCQATGDGGGFFIDAASTATAFQFASSSCVSDVAVGDGGGLCVRNGSAASISLTGADVHPCQFFFCEAANGGGANLVDANVTFDQVYCYTNTCTGNGGGMYLGAVNGGGQIVGGNENHADGHGGAFYVASGCDLFLDDLSVEVSNTAPEGAEIYFDAGIDVHVNCPSWDPELLGGPGLTGGEVVVTEDGCDGVATEGIDWGSIKAMFR